MDIDWLSDESHLLLNPRMPEEERRRLQSMMTGLPGHLWLATSGTTGALKLVALSKRAMLVSAAAVNRHLQSAAGDVWYCVLPAFHVGGLGIHARAFLSGARVETAPWWPDSGARMAGATLTALVPAQVVDLVRSEIAAPRSLRAVVVGGGAISQELYGRARALGWPLLPSYGLTECGSQVATARADSPELHLLDHVEARVETDGRLALWSQSLLTGYATESGFVDPKAGGWFVTEDVASLQGRVLRVEGRRGDFVKVGGESVDLSRLDRILAELGADAAAIAVPDERLGHVIGLAVASAGILSLGDSLVDPFNSSPDSSLVRAFNERVLPFERARSVRRVPEIPRTALGKIVRSRLS